MNPILTKNELLERFTYLKTAQIPKNDLIIIDGSIMKEGRSNVTEIYRALGLIEYIPYANYDGLDELLSRDIWPKREHLYLGIKNVDDLLKNNPFSDVITLFEILEEKVESWEKAVPPGVFEVYLI